MKLYGIVNGNGEHIAIDADGEMWIDKDQQVTGCRSELIDLRDAIDEFLEDTASDEDEGDEDS